MPSQACKETRNDIAVQSGHRVGKTQIRTEQEGRVAGRA